MSYLERRPQPIIEPPSKRVYPIVLAVIFVIVVIIIVILIIVFTRKTPAAMKCTSDSNCSGATPKCNTTSGSCVGCLTTSDCGAGKICSTGNNCINKTCQSNADCPSTAPKCNTTSGICLQCLIASDCPVSGSTCNANGTCIEPCTGTPNPVTNVQIVGSGTDTHTITWTPPVVGQPIANYIVTRQAGDCRTCCSTAPVPPMSTYSNPQIIPFGTNQAVFNNLTPGASCYRVQTENNCGTTPLDSNLSSAPNVAGITCGSKPTAFPIDSYDFTIDSFCIHSYSFDCNSGDNCPCSCPTCPVNNLGRSTDCNCPGDCFGPICPSTDPSRVCGTQLAWRGPTAPSTELLIFTRTNVTIGGKDFLDNEATLIYSLDQTNVPGNPHNLANTEIKCGRTSTIANYHVSQYLSANVTMPPPGGNPGDPRVYGNNLKVEWDALQGVDEYAIMILFSSESFGTLIPANLVQTDQVTGKLFYQFSNKIPDMAEFSSAFIFVYGYSLCNKSTESAAKSVSSGSA